MVIGECLERAMTIDRRRRFYAPGQHPATYRDRVVLAQLERIAHIRDREDWMLTEAIVYHRRRIDEFEAHECLVKARYIEAEGPWSEGAARVVRRLREESGVEASWW